MAIPRPPGQLRGSSASTSSTSVNALRATPTPATVSRRPPATCSSAGSRVYRTGRAATRPRVARRSAARRARLPTRRARPFGASSEAALRARSRAVGTLPARRTPAAADLRAPPQLPERVRAGGARSASARSDRLTRFTYPARICRLARGAVAASAAALLLIPVGAAGALGRSPAAGLGLAELRERASQDGCDAAALDPSVARIVLVALGRRHGHDAAARRPQCPRARADDGVRRERRRAPHRLCAERLRALAAQSRHAPERVPATRPVRHHRHAGRRPRDARDLRRRCVRVPARARSGIGRGASRLAGATLRRPGGRAGLGCAGRRPRLDLRRDRLVLRPADGGKADPRQRSPTGGVAASRSVPKSLGGGGSIWGWGGPRTARDRIDSSS